MARHIAFCATIVLMGLGGFAATGAGETRMKVIDSDTAEVVIGSEWPESQPLPIPPGRRVRVLLLPSNVTKELRGPPAENPEQEAPWGGMRGAPKRAGDGK
jgi:hypothetical protein